MHSSLNDSVCGTWYVNKVIKQIVLRVNRLAVCHLSVRHTIPDDLKNKSFQNNLFKSVKFITATATALEANNEKI